MSSISAMAGSMMVGTKKTWVMPWACTASAKYRLPVMRGMGTSSKRWSYPSSDDYFAKSSGESSIGAPCGVRSAARSQASR